MLDRNQYEMYQVNGMPDNVFVGVDKAWLNRKENDVTEAGLTVHPDLAPMVKEFAERNPSWVIEARYQTWSDNYRIDDLRVYADGEYLGHISYFANNKKFVISSNSIVANLDRGTHRSTKCEKKARKLLNSIMPQTDAMKIDKAKVRLQHCFNNVRRQYFQEATSIYDVLTTYLRPYLIQNWEKVSKAAMELGFTREMADKFLPAMEMLDTVRFLVDNEDTALVYVYVEEGRYIVASPEELGKDKEYKVYNSSDDVPDYIRRGIGLLKLADEGFLPEVGYKDGDNKFCIIIGENK